MSRPIKFVDLFAGMGGATLALEAMGAECVLSLETDPEARDVYALNFGEEPKIRLEEDDLIMLPSFDLLCARFDYRSVSRLKAEDLVGRVGQLDAGRLGSALSFLEQTMPRLFIFETEPRLLTVDKGRVFDSLMDQLTKLEYTVSYKKWNMNQFVVPQSKERVVIVGCLDGHSFDMDSVNTHELGSMRVDLEDKGPFDYLGSHQCTLLPEDRRKRQEKGGTIFAGYRNTKKTLSLKDDVDQLYQSRTHQQHGRIFSIDGLFPAISPSETSGRYFITNDQWVRRLTMTEVFRFSGFPDWFKKGDSRRPFLYEAVGNSVNPVMIMHLYKAMEDQGLL